MDSQADAEAANKAMHVKTLVVDNRGSANVVLALVTFAIVLYVASIVIGKLSSLNLTLTGCSSPALTTGVCQTYQYLQNLSALAQNALTIASIGLLIMAAIGILSYFGVGFGGRGRGRK